jgi:dephospho-CoA kinase
VKTVGLTGGIACGKSTVGRLLAQRGVPVLDLDAVAREVVAPGEPALAAIAARWPGVVRDGALDRAALAAIVFTDSDARAALEAITHPAIRTRTEAWLDAQRARGAPFAVVEAALLVETGAWRRYDALLVVACSPDVQRARLQARDHCSAGEAQRRIAAQLPLADKERLATVVVHNDGDAEALSNATAAAWDAILQRTPTA